MWFKRQDELDDRRGRVAEKLLVHGVFILAQIENRTDGRTGGGLQSNRWNFLVEIQLCMYFAFTIHQMFRCVRASSDFVSSTLRLTIVDVGRQGWCWWFKPFEFYMHTTSTYSSYFLAPALSLSPSKVSSVCVCVCGAGEIKNLSDCNALMCNVHRACRTFSELSNWCYFCCAQQKIRQKIKHSSLELFLLIHISYFA